jgi:hypothetical protein
VFLRCQYSENCKFTDKETYLNHYHGVDSMDHMIKNTGNYFISWKYWYSPYLHAMSMGVIAAYDMYLECSEGMLDAAWMVAKKDRMSFSQFRLRLSEQMLMYDPRNDLYAGNNKFRRTTQMHKCRSPGIWRWTDRILPASHSRQHH